MATRLWPRLIGHRGAAAHAPENTLAGFARAAAMGVTMVEFDARLSADGVVVLMHDERVDRTTDGSGLVREMTLAELKALDAGSWFGPTFTGERVPTLEEALTLLAALGIEADIEIKPCPGRERETAEKVMETALACWPADRPPPLISSFRPECLIVARQAAPDWPRALLIWEPPASLVELMEQVAPDALDLGWQKLTPAFMEMCRATGLPLLVYTVNDEPTARRLLTEGAVSLITDSPDVLEMLVEAEGALG